MECNNGINIPSLNSDPCNGETKPATCVIFQNSITYLGLPANSTLEEVLVALLLSLKDARDRIEVLETP